MHKNYNESIQYPILNAIIEKSRKIQFNHKEHKYFLDRFELNAVSNFISNYKKEFESHKIANRLCRLYNDKHKLVGKYLERKPDYYLELWNSIREMACHRGTMIHLYAESYPYFDEPKIKEHHYIHNFFNELNSKYIFIGSEIRVYSTSLKIAGTLDCLLFNKETKKYVVVDWKSNGDIYKKENGYFLEPFDKFKNNKLNSYTLQLNFYKHCLEEMFKANFEIEELWIVWLTDNNDDYKLIPLQILNLNDYLNIN